MPNTRKSKHKARSSEDSDEDYEPEEAHELLPRRSAAVTGTRTSKAKRARCDLFPKLAAS